MRIYRITINSVDVSPCVLSTHRDVFAFKLWICCNRSIAIDSTRNANKKKEHLHHWKRHQRIWFYYVQRQKRGKNSYWNLSIRLNHITKLKCNHFIFFLLFPLLRLPACCLKSQHKIYIEMANSRNLFFIFTVCACVYFYCKLIR